MDRDLLVLCVVTAYVIIRGPEWKYIESQYGLKFLCQVTRFFPLCVLWATWLLFNVIDPWLRQSRPNFHWL